MDLRHRNNVNVMGNGSTTLVVFPWLWLQPGHVELPAALFHRAFSRGAV